MPVPEVCEQTGITLTRYMCEVARANPELQELESLLAAIQTAGKTINSLVNRAHITGLVGYADGGGSINVQGEEQKTLDIVTNDVLKKALRFTGKMGVIASEEEDNPVDTSDMAGLPAYETTALMDETGRYTAVFDPLDGSSNVDAGIPTGTIFGIFDAQDCLLPEEACDTADEKFTGDTAECSVDAPSAECLAATLQPGTSLVASGTSCTRARRSSRSHSAPACRRAQTRRATRRAIRRRAPTDMRSSLQIFTLDISIGEFVLTHPDVQLPRRGGIYSFNEANRVYWDPPLRSYVEDIQQGLGERQAVQLAVHWLDGRRRPPHAALRRHLRLPRRREEHERQAAAAVRGGADGVPDRAGGRPRAHRLTRIHPIPQNVHQRVPVILGSPDDVREVRARHRCIPPTPPSLNLYSPPPPPRSSAAATRSLMGSNTMGDSDEAAAIRARCFTRRRRASRSTRRWTACPTRSRSTRRRRTRRQGGQDRDAENT